MQGWSHLFRIKTEGMQAGSNDKKYIDFLSGITEMIDDREVVREPFVFTSVHMYECHTRVCIASDEFVFALIEKEFIAYFFDDVVNIYASTVSDILLTDLHDQIKFN